MESNVGRAVYIYPSGPIVAQTVDTLDGDRERHLDHNHILSQQSVSVGDERIRTYMHVPHCSTRIRSAPHRGLDRDNPVQTYMKERPGRGRPCHQKLSNRDHIASKRNKSYQNEHCIDPHHFVLKPNIKT